MSGRGVGAGSGRSGKSFEQLEREVAELRRLVKELTQPKSKARVILPSLAGEMRIYLTPALGIPARSLTTPGAATCDLVTLGDGTLATEISTQSVYNIFAVEIPGSTYIFGQRIADSVVAIHPLVMDVRWVSPNLQQTKDGANYTNIDTAVNCT